MRTIGRRPKRRMQPKGTAEIAENNLAIRPSKALKKKNVGEDPELEEFLDALPKEPTSSLLEALQTLGRRPKRRMQPKGEAEIAENNLAIRLCKALKKKKVGEDPELEEFLNALPKKPRRKTPAEQFSSILAAEAKKPRETVDTRSATGSMSGAAE